MAANTEDKLRTTFFFYLCQDFNALIHSGKQSSKFCMSSGIDYTAMHRTTLPETAG